MLNPRPPARRLPSCPRPEHRVRCSAVGVIVLDVAAVVCTSLEGGFLTLATAVLLTRGSSWSIGAGTGAGWFAPSLLASRSVILLLLPSRSWVTWAPHGLESDSTGSAQQRWEDMHSAGDWSVSARSSCAGIGIGRRGTEFRSAVRCGPGCTTCTCSTRSISDCRGAFLFLCLFGSCLPLRVPPRPRLAATSRPSCRACVQPAGLASQPCSTRGLRLLLLLHGGPGRGGGTDRTRSHALPSAMRLAGLRP